MQAVRQNWLFLGEACYRFSLAVARSGLSGSSKCVATSFGDLDGEEKSKAKEELLRFGFECKDNVDATCLEDVAWGEAKPPFDRVFFMFPHGPKKGRVDLCSQLVAKSCRSVNKVLACDGRLYLALAKGQGGTVLDDKRTNNWNVMANAASGGLFLSKVEAFATHPFGESMTKFGYVPTGRRGHDAVFRTDGALMHELTRKHLASDAFQLEYFPRDVSFFCHDGTNLDLVVAFCNGMPNVFDCFLFDSFAFKDGRQSKTLRMRFRGFLSLEDANVLQKELGEELHKRFQVVIR